MEAPGLLLRAIVVSASLVLATGAGAMGPKLGPSPPEDLSDAHAELVGEAGDEAGFNVADAGDVNADGVRDWIVGATGHEDAGAAYIVHGPANGTLSVAEADAVLLGERSGDDAGYSVAGAGDVNADGYDDVIVGAPTNGEAGLLAGKAYLVYGPITGDSSLADADVVLEGERSFDHFGQGVAGAGDVNGDGYDDVIVGAPFSDRAAEGAGQAYLFHGPLGPSTSASDPDARLVGESAGGSAGEVATGVGDVNADGFDDVIVGAPFDGEGGFKAGAAYLVHGPIAGTVDLAEADAKLVGEPGVHFTGEVVGPGGDVTGDGDPDLLVAAHDNLPGDPGPGHVYVVDTPVSGTVSLADADVILRGEETGDEAGYAAAVGDVNGDGHDDVIVGAPFHDGGAKNAGTVYFAYGPLEGESSLANARFELTGEREGDEAGRSVARLADPAGTVDVLVGAPEATNGDGEATGKAYAIYSERLDRDGDGLPDQRERAIGTDVLDPDTDGDLAQDGHEVDCGSDPLDPTSRPTPLAGTPGAGAEPLEETQDLRPLPRIAGCSWSPS